MNRYYRPSAPRYTSQFVEDQYPMDMILQSGAMKYQQKQQFAENVGQLNALNASLTPGYRTMRMAPEVISSWDKKINDTIARLGNNYDSPSALMEFSKLKTQWERDPNVNLIKYDREMGNKEWDDYKKSPTLNLDINPNADPRTGMLKQFNPGDTYTPYSPLIKYADVPERAINEYKTIETQKRSGFKEEAYTDPYGRPGIRKVQTDVEYRDPNMINEKTQSLIERTKAKSEPWSAYHYEDLKRKLGRNPTDAEIARSFEPFARSSMVANETSRTNTDVVDLTKGTEGGTGITGMNSGQGITFRTPISVRTEGTARVGVSDIRQIDTDKMFGKTREMNPYEKALQKRVLASNPNLDREGQLKEMKRIIKEERDRPYTLKYNYWGPDVEKEVNTVFGGGINDKGELTAEGTKTMFEGSTLIDLTTGKYVQDIDDKGALTEKGNILRVLGTADKNDKAMQPQPGSIFIESVSGGKSKMYLLKSEDLAQKEKPIWNFNGYQRDPLTGIGDVFAIDFYSDGTNHQEQYYDMSDPNTNNDQKNIQAQTANGLYFVPQREFGKGEVKVKVFAANPTGTDLEDVQNNPLYLKEYKVSDYNGSMQKLRDKILEDVYNTKGDSNLLTYRNKIMKERFPNK